MKKKHILLSILIFFLLIPLMIYSIQEYKQNDPHIQACQIVYSDHYNHTELTFLGYIWNVNKTNQTCLVTIQEEPYHYPPITLHTDNITIQKLKKGDLIDVKGTFTGPNQMTATYLWRNDPLKENFVILRSLLALPIIFFLFLRTWKFDTTSLRFERRKKNG